MDWSKGFSASYFAKFVDPQTFRGMERFEITEGTITRTEANLRESADIGCKNYTAGEKWIRLYLCAKQRDSKATIPLFTGLACSPDSDINGHVINNSIQIYSVLKPADDILLEPGWYVPAGFNAAGMIKKLLSVSPAPVHIANNSPALFEAIIAEGDETNLSMAEKILKAIGWRLRILGDGTIYIQGEAEKVSGIFDAISNDVIEPKVKLSRDWYGCPNVFRAVSGDLTAVAKDEMPASPLSVVSRGREIWSQDSSCNLNDGESIAEYAMRRLKEEQQHAISVSYDRRFDPNILAGDLIRLNYPAQGLMGVYKVVSQTVSLNHGASTAEEVVKI